MERELLLLGLLRQEEMHGYQLHSIVDGVLSSYVDLKKPTTYALLDRMMATGWISAREEREGNRPPPPYVQDYGGGGGCVSAVVARESWNVISDPIQE